MRIAVRRSPRVVAHLTAMLAVGALLAPHRATAEPGPPAPQPTVALEWSGPGREADCLGAERLENAVDDYLGRSAFDVGPTDIALRVRVERTSQGWRALVQLGETGSGRVLGERELLTDDPRCASLDEPLKLAVALLVDDDIAPAGPGESAPESKPVARAPESDPEEELEQEPPAPRSATPKVMAHASLLMELGALPGALPGLELGVAWLPTSWLLTRLDAGAFLPRSVAAGQDEVLFSFAYAGAAVCPLARIDSSWSLAFCGGARVGALLANASELDAGRNRRRQVFFSSLGLRPSWDLTSHLTLSASVEALFPFRSERFIYDLDGERRILFQLKSPVWLGGVGVAVRF